MSIETELTKLQTNLSNAYASCENKGATMPSSQNFDNLATTIDSIETGGGGITPTGTISITENGTYDVTNYASAEVSVEGGGGSESSSGAFEIIYGTDVEPMILPESTIIKEGAFRNACTNYQETTFALHDWWTLDSPDENGTLVAESKAFQETFKGNLNILEINLSGIGQFNANDVLLDCLVDTEVELIIFSGNVVSQVRNQIGYDNKFGAPTATIMFNN